MSKAETPSIKRSDVVHAFALLESNVPTFSGSYDGTDSNTWCKDLSKWLDLLFTASDEEMFKVSAVRRRLTGRAHEITHALTFDSIQQIINHLKREFPAEEYASHQQKRVDAGTVFNGMSGSAAAREAKRLFTTLDKTSNTATKLLTLLCKQYPILVFKVKVTNSPTTSANFEDWLEKLESTAHHLDSMPGLEEALISKLRGNPSHQTSSQPQQAAFRSVVQPPTQSGNGNNTANQSAPSTPGKRMAKYKARISALEEKLRSLGIDPSKDTLTQGKA
jgi:hypothetical protein